MTRDEDGNAPDQPASRYLVARMLGHWDTRYPAWAFVGLCHLPRAVHQDLGPEALLAVRRLRLLLLDRLTGAWRLVPPDRFTAAGRLGSTEIRPVAAAVHACGEWWPMPELGTRMVREGSGLDVPAVWGLEALRRHLRPEMVDARDILDDRDMTKNIAKTLAATGDLVNELCAAIGGRYGNSKAKTTALKLDVAWRRFDAARARSGGITVLPLFVMQAAPRVP